MPGLLFFFYYCFPFAQIFTDITPSTITVDSVNHTYTGTLSSSTYSGYKLAASTNKIVSSGSHTLTGYTGNNITLAITGNTVNVTNSKTSTTRTTELQNFIKSNWSQKFWKNVNFGYGNATLLGYISDVYGENYDRTTYKIEAHLTRLTSRISVANDRWNYEYITYADENGHSATDYITDGLFHNRVWWYNDLQAIELFRDGNHLIHRRTEYRKIFNSEKFYYKYAAAMNVF